MAAELRGVFEAVSTNGGTLEVSRRGPARNGSDAMFERFTEQSRRTVVLAQEEATRFNHNYIGTEHLLAGLRRGHNR